MGLTPSKRCCGLVPFPELEEKTEVAGLEDSNIEGAKLIEIKPFNGTPGKIWVLPHDTMQDIDKKFRKTHGAQPRVYRRLNKYDDFEWGKPFLQSHGRNIPWNEKYEDVRSGFLNYEGQGLTPGSGFATMG